MIASTIGKATVQRFRWRVGVVCLLVLALNITCARRMNLKRQGVRLRMSQMIPWDNFDKHPQWQKLGQIALEQGLQNIASRLEYAGNIELAKRVRTMRVSVNMDSDILGAAHVRSDRAVDHIEIDVGYLVRVGAFSGTVACMYSKPAMVPPTASGSRVPKLLDGEEVLTLLLEWNRRYLSRHPRKFGIYTNPPCFDYKSTRSNAVMTMVANTVIDSVVIWTILHELAHVTLGHNDCIDDPSVVIGPEDRACGDYVSNDVLRDQELAADRWAAAKMREMGMSLLYLRQYLFVASEVEALWNEMYPRPLKTRRVLAGEGTPHPTFATRLQRFEQEHPTYATEKPRKPYFIVLELDNYTCLWGVPEQSFAEMHSTGGAKAVFADLLMCEEYFTIDPEMEELEFESGITWLGLEDDEGIKLRVFSLEENSIRGARAEFRFLPNGLIEHEINDGKLKGEGFILNRKVGLLPSGSDEGFKFKLSTVEQFGSYFTQIGVPDDMLDEATTRYRERFESAIFVLAKVAADNIDEQTGRAQIDEIKQDWKTWLEALAGPDADEKLEELLRQAREEAKPTPTPGAR